MKCSHNRTTTRDERVFTHPVAHPPYTEENPRAHGGITYTEVCTECGADRRVNQNMLHEEHGAWGPSAAEQRREADRKKAALKEAEHADQDRALQEHGGGVLQRQGDCVLVDIRGESKWHDIGAIQATVRRTADPEIRAFWFGILRLARSVRDESEGLL